MAKHLNIDTITTLQEPVSFTVNGKRYEALDLTDERMQANQDIADRGDILVNEKLVLQLANMTGADADDFRSLTLSQKNALIQHITESQFDPLGKQRSGQRR